MSYSILIYCLVPESIQVYMVPDIVADSYRNYLEQAHGVYENTEKSINNDGVRFLSAACMDREYDYENDDEFKEYAHMFHEYMVYNETNDRGQKIQTVKSQNVSNIYVSGFLL